MSVLRLGARAVLDSGCRVIRGWVFPAFLLLKDERLAPKVAKGPPKP